MALLTIGGYFTHRSYKSFMIVWIALTILSLDNSLNIIYNQVSHQKQFLF
jgi:EamA domain-containing membrane protein RarD